MTDPTPVQPGTQKTVDGDPAAVRGEDRTGKSPIHSPAETPAQPSTGGEGAAGAGGPKGFGTGT